MMLSAAVGAARDIRLGEHLAEGAFFVVPIDDHAAALLLEHDIHKEFLGRHFEHLRNFLDELPVDFWVVDAEAHMMPADIRQVRLLVHETRSDALTLLGIAQPLEHRLTAAFLRQAGIYAESPVMPHV